MEATKTIEKVNGAMLRLGDAIGEASSSFDTHPEGCYETGHAAACSIGANLEGFAFVKSLDDTDIARLIEGASVRRFDVSNNIFAAYKGESTFFFHAIKSGNGMIFLDSWVVADMPSDSHHLLPKLGGIEGWVAGY